MRSQGLAVHTETLGKYSPARTVNTAELVGPGHYETTARQPCDLWIDLAAKNLGIDQEFRPDNHAIGRVALTKNTTAGAVLLV